VAYGTAVDCRCGASGLTPTLALARARDAQRSPRRKHRARN